MRLVLLLSLLVFPLVSMADTECGIRANKATQPPKTDIEADVKPLLIHGIELYIQQKYTVAIKYFQEVQKLDPTNELAKQYIESSRQKVTELELQKELDEANKSLEK